MRKQIEQLTALAHRYINGYAKPMGLENKKEVCLRGCEAGETRGNRIAIYRNEGFFVVNFAKVKVANVEIVINNNELSHFDLYGLPTDTMLKKLHDDAKEYLEKLLPKVEAEKQKNEKQKITELQKRIKDATEALKELTPIVP